MAWDIVYYRRASGRVPVDEFLAGCPVKVRARLLAVLDDVAEAPPPQFSGGGRWEAMHGTMRGYYEVRIQGPELSNTTAAHGTDARDLSTWLRRLPLTAQ